MLLPCLLQKCKKRIPRNAKRNAKGMKGAESMKGDRFCTVCKCWIGNYLTGFTPYGERSYHSIIRSKYCNECRPLMISQQTKVRLHNLRQRKKQEHKQEKTKLDLLEQENELLREYIKELRELLPEKRL